MTSGPLSSSGDIGLLLSGGLDSCILLADLLRQGRRVQPFYVRTGLVWQERELSAVHDFLRAIAAEPLRELVILDLPLADLYGRHWSVTGCETPGAQSPDEAVFLPGRNALLLIKPVIWCQLNGVRELAIAPLGTSPFADAGPEFFADFQAALNRGGAAPLRLSPLRLSRPFGGMTKRQVMELGRGLPLELTFSCISPAGSRHCGRCNKCAERQAAFRAANLADKTEYALSPA